MIDEGDGMSGPAASDLAADSKLIRIVVQRTVNALSRWAVPLMFAAIAGLLKLGYDGFVNEFQKLRDELSVAVKVINEARQADLNSIDARLEQNAIQSQHAQVERLAYVERLASLEITAKRNAEWINRTEVRAERTEESMSKLREDVAAIRAVLEINRKPPAPPMDLGRIPMMMWHF